MLKMLLLALACPPGSDRHTAPACTHGLSSVPSDSQSDSQSDSRPRVWMMALAMLLTTALLPATTTPAAWGQGASRATSQDVQANVETTQAPDRANQRPSVVDLRDNLPEVGEQSMNDCVGWAYAYAARSYLEAINQGWKPDDPARIFSPTFVYNQINKGKDKGSSPVDAMKLMQEHGAATLRSQPYLAKNYLQSVNPQAKNEASNFRIERYGMLDNGEKVKNVLAAGLVVCITVRTNPIFSGGRYDVYTKDMHERGIQMRRPDQPHGYHAMVIAGYDDAKQAFLVMNSWGKNWGQDGYVWVAYDVANTFNLNNPDTQHLIDHALVMIDRLEPVVDTADGYKVASPDQLQLVHRFRVSGMTDDNQPIHDVTVGLAGPDALLDTIETVRWQYDSPEGVQTAEPVGKRLVFGTPLRRFGVKATMHLKDGRDLEQAVVIDLPQAIQRHAAVKRIDAMHDWTSSKDPVWYRSTFVPQLNAQDWAALDHIEWTVQGFDPSRNAQMRPNLQPLPAPAPGNGNGGQAGGAVIQTATFTPDGPSQPATRQPSLAYPSGIAQTAPTGTARFVFKDGNTIDVALPDLPYPANPGQAAIASSTARAVGDYLGHSWYLVEHQVTVPERWHPWLVGASFRGEGLWHDDRELRGHITDGLEPLSVVAMEHANIPYNVTSIVHLRRGPQPTVHGSGLPSLSVKQLLAGQNGRVHETVQVLAPPTVPIPGDSFGIRYNDTYLGINAQGQPMWRFYPFFSELKWGRTWHTPYDVDGWQLQSPDQAAKAAEARVYEEWDNPDGGLPHLAVDATAQSTLAIDAELFDAKSDKPFEGQPHHITTTLLPHSPATRGLGLVAFASGPDRLHALVNIPEDLPLWEAKLQGGLWEQQQVESLTYLVPQAGGWVQSWMQRNDDVTRPDLSLPPAVLPAGADDHQPVRAVARLLDGRVQALETTVQGRLPYEAPPPLRLTATSQYWGLVNGLPHWQANLQIDGQLSALQHLADVRFEAVDETGRTIAWETPTWDRNKQTVQTNALVHGPVRVQAVVQLDNDPNPHTLHATVLTPADTVLPEGRLALAHTHLQTYQKPYSPNTNSFEVADPVDHFLLRPVGPAKLLAELDHIALQVTGAMPTNQHPEGELSLKLGRDGLGHDQLPCPTDAFAWAFPYGYDPMVVEATYHFKDGTTQTETHTLDIDAWYNERRKQSFDVAVQPLSKSPSRWLVGLQFTEPLSAFGQTLATTYATNGTDWPSSFHQPNQAQTIQTESPLILQSFQQLYMGKFDDEPKNRNVNLRGDKQVVIALPEVRPNRLRVEAAPGTNNQAWQFTPDFNGRHFENIQSFHYTVTTAEGTKRVEPLQWAGPAHERLAMVWTGGKPLGLVAVCVMADGREKTLASWGSP